MSQVPSPQRSIDRAALERVLARAAELQGATGDSHDGLTESQILDLGKEVGITPDALRQALAEERAGVRVQPERGLSATLYGTSRVAANRTIRGNATDVTRALDAWMDRCEGLVVKRRTAERVSWEAHGGVAKALARAFNVGGRGYHLARAVEVSATLVPLDASRVVVRLEADFGHHRRATLRRTVAASGFGALSSGALAMMGVALGVAALPVVAVTGGAVYLGRASHAQVIARGQLALEQVLDRLEDGGTAPGGIATLLKTLVSSVERELRR